MNNVIFFHYFATILFLPNHWQTWMKTSRCTHQFESRFLVRPASSSPWRGPRRWPWFQQQQQVSRRASAAESLLAIGRMFLWLRSAGGVNAQLFISPWLRETRRGARASAYFCVRLHLRPAWDGVRASLREWAAAERRADETPSASTTAAASSSRIQRVVGAPASPPPPQPRNRPYTA